MIIIKQYIKEYTTPKGELCKIPYYQLKCDCGVLIERPKSRHDLKPEATCGKGACSIHVKKMIGQKFGRLTIISHHSREKGYNCLCDCGNTTVAKIYELKSGRWASCGCLMREKLSKRAYKGLNVSAKHNIFKQYQSAAKRRGYCFNLPKDYFLKLIESPCHYCGAENSMSTETKLKLQENDIYYYNGVDRVDNTIGYTVENCVPCCKICNNSKNTLSLKDWKAWIYKIYHKLSNPN